MDILYITQTFPPEPGATKRPFRQALALSKLGHKVTVITSFPNYPEGRVWSEYRGKLWTWEVMEGIDVLRVWSITAPNQGILRRIISFGSFACSSMFVALLLRSRSIVIGSVMKPGTELAALTAARLKGAFSVLEIRDLPPDAWRKVGLIGPRMNRLLEVIYKRIWRAADFCVVPCHGIAQRLRALDIQQNQILFLPHAADFDEIDRWDGAAVRMELGLADRFVALYAGSFAPHYAIPIMALAAERLAEQYPEFILVLIGTGPDADNLRALLERRQITNVRTLGPIPPVEVGKYLKAADLFLNPLWFQFPGEFVGTKIVEYLAAGRPVISCVPDGERNGLLDEAGVGLEVDHGDPHALADAIQHYLEDREAAAKAGRLARKLAESRFERNRVVATFERELMQALEQRMSLTRQRDDR